jgi:hypothetical protein
MTNEKEELHRVDSMLDEFGVKPLMTFSLSIGSLSLLLRHLAKSQAVW